MPLRCPPEGFLLLTGEAAETGNQPVIHMNQNRHYLNRGRAPRPPFSPAFGIRLPFLQETTGASHDLLLLNPRPDLTPAEATGSASDDDPVFDEVGSTTAFLQRCFAGFQI